MALVQIRNPKLRDKRTIALFDLGLRPFFLAASLFAGGSVLWWVLAFAGLITPAAGWPAHLQHAHEMVFGFGGAAVAGFLLTATANWTGRKPIKGAPLAALAGLWLAGRVVFVLAAVPGSLRAAVDVAFLAALLLSLWPALRAGQARNLPFIGWLLVFAAANLATHLQVLGVTPVGLIHGLHAGVYTLAMLVAIVGGRVIPNFTRNALRLAGRPHATSTHPKVDFGAKASLLAALVADLLALPSAAAASLSALAACLLALRMRHWRSLQTLAHPIVWVLHVAHLWLVVAMGLLALAHLGLAIPPTAPLHALTAGAIGTMVLAIMTRASLGHTGRPLHVTRPITLAYLLLTAGACLRTFAPLLPALDYRAIVVLAGTAWAGAYLIFAVVYAPVLLRPRADGQ